MHCRLEKAYHTALFVPPPSPITTVKSTSASLKETWINHLAISSGTVDPVWDCWPRLGLSTVWSRQFVTDPWKWHWWMKGPVFPVRILERGFVQMSWWRLCIVLEDHLDWALLVAGSSGLNFCPLMILLFRGSLSLGIWRVGKMGFRLYEVERWDSSGSPRLLEHITPGYLPGQTVGAQGVVKGSGKPGPQPQLSYYIGKKMQVSSKARGFPDWWKIQS